MNLVKMNVSDPTPTNSPKDFKAQVIINNHLGTVLVDARAKASAFGPIQTNKCRLVEKLHLRQHRLGKEEKA